MKLQEFNEMMKDSFGDRVISIPSKTDNELIAEFMGFTYEKNIGWYDNEMLMSQNVYDNQDGNCFDELLFDKSWDWLMPVVEKIENFIFDENNSYNVTIGSTNYCVIQDSNGDTIEIIKDNGKSKLETTYQAVVEFIKEHNKTI